MLNEIVISEAAGFNWFEPTLNMLGILIAGGIVVWQVHVQLKENRELQKEETKKNLWLSINREISDQIRLCQNAVSESTSYANSTLSEVELTKSLQFVGRLPAFHKRRAMDFSDINADGLKSITKLISVLERNEIICPDLTIFRTALSVIHRDLMNYQSSIFSHMLRTLPMDIPPDDRVQGGPNVYYQPQITDEALESLKTTTDNYYNSGLDLGCYLFDLNVESQNVLLGSLFDHIVPRREPIDPVHKVIITSPQNEVDELINYFMNETEWGRSQRQAEEDAEQNLE